MTFQRRDLPGYLSVVRIRGGKTIFTEGPSDRRALARTIRELEARGLVSRGEVFVDCAEVVEFPGEGLGMREVVERVQAAANAAGLALCSLTDREFRNFSASSVEFRDDLQGHNVLSTGEVWTRGHSIENYFFDVGFVQKYLHFRYPDAIPPAAMQALPGYWRTLLQCTAALSVAAKNAELLSRLRGAFTLNDWEVQPPVDIRLRPEAVEQAALRRHLVAPKAATFRQEFEALLPASQSCCDVECSRWISHGHLGDELIWLGVAAVLYAHGTPRMTASELSTGHRDEKERHRADEWARLHCEAPRTIETPLPLWRALGVGV